MLFSRIAELSQQFDTDKFKLLMHMIDEDIKFHRGIGTNYNEDKIINLIDNTVRVIERF